MKFLLYATTVSITLLACTAFNFWFFDRFKAHRCISTAKETTARRLTAPSLGMGLLALLLLLLTGCHCAATLYFDRQSLYNPQALRSLRAPERALGIFLKLAPFIAPFALMVFVLLLGVQALIFGVDGQCKQVRDALGAESPLRRVLLPALVVNGCLWLALAGVLPWCRMGIHRHYFAWRPAVKGGSAFLNFFRRFSLL